MEELREGRILGRSDMDSCGMRHVGHYAGMGVYKSGSHGFLVKELGNDEYKICFRYVSERDTEDKYAKE